MVPRLFAVIIVGLSFFQQTALVKYDPASSPSVASELNPCEAAGLEIAYNKCFQLNLRPMTLKASLFLELFRLEPKSSLFKKLLSENSLITNKKSLKLEGNLMVHKDFICLAATCNIFAIYS